eukprot:5532011-Prymnesium_polylepis.2
MARAGVGAGGGGAAERRAPRWRLRCCGGGGGGAAGEAAGCSSSLELQLGASPSLTSSADGSAAACCVKAPSGVEQLGARQRVRTHGGDVGCACVVDQVGVFFVAQEAVELERLGCLPAEERLDRGVRDAALLEGARQVAPEAVRAAEPSGAPSLVTKRAVRSRCCRPWRGRRSSRAPRARAAQMGACEWYRSEVAILQTSQLLLRGVGCLDAADAPAEVVAREAGGAERGAAAEGDFCLAEA